MSIFHGPEGRVGEAGLSKEAVVLSGPVECVNAVVR